MKIDLTGRTAVITGGSRGLGRAYGGGSQGQRAGYEYCSQAKLLHGDSSRRRRSLERPADRKMEIRPPVVVRIYLPETGHGVVERRGVRKGRPIGHDRRL